MEEGLRDGKPQPHRDAPQSQDTGLSRLEVGCCGAAVRGEPHPGLSGLKIRVKILPPAQSADPVV